MAVLAAFFPRFGGLGAVVGEVATGRLAAFSPGLRGLLTIIGKITRILLAVVMMALRYQLMRWRPVYPTDN